MSTATTPPAGTAHPGLTPLQVYPSLSLDAARAATRFERPLPRHWAASFDVRLGRASGVRVQVGGTGSGFVSSGPGGWQHVELTPGHETIDGRPSAFAVPSGSTLTIQASQGHVQIRALVISDARDPAGLLLERLAELHARLRRGQFPVGADLGNHLHIDSRYWTSGFWPGALWQAADLVPGPGRAMFERWALEATVAHLGGERADTHDVGFEYGESSLAAWEAVCRARANGGAALDPSRRESPKSVCGRLRHSVIAAAGELLTLAATNRRASTIPTNSQGPRADTIIDSIMNAALILPAASGASGDPAYARLAARHAHAVARLLVRRDGSTAQAVDFDRATGRALSIGTHQGLSASSTWSRGQGWAVYGFSRLAQELRDRSLLRVALKAAAYVQRHLPPEGIPRWDYDAPAGAPVDVSAGVITAAGLFHLASACTSLPGVCGPTRPWLALGRRMLAASLARAYTRPPLGLLPDQVLNEHGHGCWCNGGELIFGLTYGLEGLGLERRVGGEVGVRGAGQP